MSIDNPIKVWREQNGKTQDQLAEKLATSPMTISRWERGTAVPRKHQLRNIKRKLGIAPEAIIKHAMGAA